MNDEDKEKYDALMELDHETLMDGLETGHRLFVSAYLTHGNGARAAREAKYSVKHPSHIACRLRKRPDVKAAIDSYWRDNTMGPVEVHARVAGHARGTMEHFIKQGDEGEVRIDVLSKEAQPFLALIRKIKVKTTRRVDRNDEESMLVEQTVDLELYDSQRALVEVGKMAGMYTTKIEHSGKIDAAYEIVTPRILDAPDDS